MNFKPRNINFKERIERHLAKQNFMHHIDFSVNRIEAGYTEGEMKLKSIHHQQDGFAHGGLVATLAVIVA
jgi:acyl-coenzyme A thioesterase PaaI-like protein